MLNLSLESHFNDQVAVVASFFADLSEISKVITGTCPVMLLAPGRVIVNTCTSATCQLAIGSKKQVILVVIFAGPVVIITPTSGSDVPAKNYRVVKYLEFLLSGSSDLKSL